MLSMGPNSSARSRRPAGPAIPGPKVLTRAPIAPLPFSDALAMPAALLPELPAPPSLALLVSGVPGVVRVELDAVRASAMREEGELVLDASEWRALVLGAEADRAWPADLAALCRRKESEPAFRIDAETALAGAQPDRCERWSAARVLERLGAHVVSIEL